MVNKTRPRINSHCHFLNFDFVPDKMIKLITKTPEWKASLAGYLDRKFLKNIQPDKPRLKEFLTTFNSNINDLVNAYMDEIYRADMDMCVPLMMDLFKSAPHATDFNTAYSNLIASETCEKDQITLISEQMINYPWRIFPFIMFDPRREYSDEICIDAIENKGFIGIKMYPALGYHPDPCLNNHPTEAFQNLFQPGANTEIRMKNVYKYCKDGKIPITTHVSIGGAYSTTLQENDSWLLTDVVNWSNPIKTYNLKINFAHLGGNYITSTPEKNDRSKLWRDQILEFIIKSQQETQFGQIYADLSYHDMALTENYLLYKKYFDDLLGLLNNNDYKNRIIFGTDASMVSHTYSEEEYILPFRTNLDMKTQNLILTYNPLAFLFQKQVYNGLNIFKIPDNYVQFLKKNNKDFVPIAPGWIKRINSDYFIVPIEEQ